MQFTLTPAEFKAKVNQRREDHLNNAPYYTTGTISASYRVAKNYRNETLMPLAFPVGAEVTSETTYQQESRKTHTNTFTVKKVNKDGTITTTGGGRWKVDTYPHGYYLTRWGSKGYHKSTKVTRVAPDTSLDQPKQAQPKTPQLLLAF